MKRILGTILVLCVSLSLAGCGDKTKTEKKTTVSTPQGESQKTEKVETKQTGENPPPPPK
jgi:hypothetical protein